MSHCISDGAQFASRRILIRIHVANGHSRKFDLFELDLDADNYVVSEILYRLKTEWEENLLKRWTMRYAWWTKHETQIRQHKDHIPRRQPVDT